METRVLPRACAAETPTAGEAPLPPLRQELELLPGPTTPGGSPGWLIHDPVRNQYFQIDWLSFELLRAWAAVPASVLLARVQQAGRAQVKAADLEQLLDFLARHQLLQAGPGSAAAWAHSRAQQLGHWGRWLLHNYLFFRIPLLHPDAFLDRSVHLLRPLFSRGFALLTLLAGLLALIGLGRQWELYSRSLVDFISWQGLLAYGLTLALVKLLHEFGHAYTAKRLGCQVPTMGLAFLVLWPVLYTDTNDVWRLRQRRQRLAVSSAGLLTEGMLAVWASFFWLLAPPGHLRDMLFLVSSTTWISTLLINASPFMRFDGYFILMDALGISNLHARAFALARWQLRRLLLGLDEPAPEDWPARQRSLLIVFAWATWIYRLVLFLGIAVLVYHFFIKLVGILLFLVEIIWFVARPVAAELGVWRERWAEVPPARRRWLPGLTVALLGLLLLLPLPGRVVVAGVLEPAGWSALYAPRGALLREVAAEQALAAQGLALALQAPQLESQQQTQAARQASIQWQSEVAALNPETRSQWDALAAQSEAIGAEGGVIRSDLGFYRQLAPHAGLWRLSDPDLRPGQWLGTGEKLGLLLQQGGAGPRVTAYVQDLELQGLRPGQRARFVADGGAGPDLDLVVERIHSDRAQTLAEAELASPAGGSVPVREQQGQRYPEGAFYRVELRAAREPDAASVTATLQHRWRGRVFIEARSQALLEPALRSAASVLVREFGF